MTYLIELILTIWAAFSVRAINRNARYGLESGIKGGHHVRSS
jgi:hypothetical protein